MMATKAVSAPIKATVYYEEKILNIDGNERVVASRLLSEPEVNIIGKEHFADSSDTLNRFGPLPESSTSRGKLTIMFNGLEYSPGRYQVSAKASWSQGDLGALYGITNPCAGDDYFGFAWGGDYDFSYAPVNIRVTDNFGVLRANVAPAKIEPNKGVVWAYNEGSTDSAQLDYVPSFNIYQDIVKNSLIGGGNTTSLVAEYIHTYGTIQGSLGFSASDNPSFSLSGGDSQWTISLAMTGIPY